MFHYNRPRRSMMVFAAAALAGVLALGALPSRARAAGEACDFLPTSEIDRSFTLTMSNVMVSGLSLNYTKITYNLAGNQVSISSDVTATDTDGRSRTSHIIAVLIALLVPGSNGFTSYTDDACLADGLPARRPMDLAACAAAGRAWNAYVGMHLRALSPQAVMVQSPEGITRWASPDFDPTATCSGAGGS